MTEVAAFPALARAKKLFLLRKHSVRRREEEAAAGSRAVQRYQASSSNGQLGDPGRPKAGGLEAARSCTSTLVAFCSDLDEQLRLVNSDVLMLSTSVRREYQRESLALEKLTSELLDAQVAAAFKAPAPAQRAVKRYRVRLRCKKPSIKLRVVLQSPGRPSTPSQKSPKPLSRVALLAHQALQASVLQTYTRCYLYQCLYRGGPAQLEAAVHLAARSRQSRTFRHWRRVVTQRAKLRLRCRRAEQRIDRTADSWARSKATAVVKEEGKYAMAKTFHACKLLAKSFRLWLAQHAAVSRSRLL
jgi:hypothetical protein